MWIILKVNKYTRIKDILEVSNFMNIKQRIILQVFDLKKLIKIKNQITSSYLFRKVCYVIGIGRFLC